MKNKLYLPETPKEMALKAFPVKIEYCNFLEERQDINKHNRKFFKNCLEKYHKKVKC